MSKIKMVLPIPKHDKNVRPNLFGIPGSENITIYDDRVEIVADSENPVQLRDLQGCAVGVIGMAMPFTIMVEPDGGYHA